MFQIYTSPDGKPGTWIRFGTIAACALAGDAYPEARKIWDLVDGRRPYVKVARSAEGRAVHLFRGGVYKRFNFGSFSEMRRVGS